MTLEIVWFCLIAVLWSGYFLLEGFDFGVGMLVPALARDDADRDDLFETIGPVWDGNEVWLVVAAGATLAAFPAWYATMFSSLYLILLLILVCLILRAVAFEWRTKADGRRWRATWLAASIGASFGAPFLWGIALSNLLFGLPLDADGHFTGGVEDLFSPYTVAAGLVVVALFAFHGSTFLVLRTAGALYDRAATATRTLALIAAPLTIGFLAWTVAVAVDRNQRGALGPAVPAVAGGLAVLVAAVCSRRGRSGWAFAMTAVATVGWTATLFTALYPRVLVSDPTFANSLTVSGAAAEHYALTVITVVAAVFTPLVVLYQGWTYHVFRHRVGGGRDGAVATSATAAEARPAAH